MYRNRPVRAAFWPYHWIIAPGSKCRRMDRPCSMYVSDGKWVPERIVTFGKPEPNWTDNIEMELNECMVYITKISVAHTV